MHANIRWGVVVAVISVLAAGAAPGDDKDQGKRATRSRGNPQPGSTAKASGPSSSGKAAGSQSGQSKQLERKGGSSSNLQRGGESFKRSTGRSPERSPSRGEAFQFPGKSGQGQGKGGAAVSPQRNDDAIRRAVEKYQPKSRQTSRDRGTSDRGTAERIERRDDSQSKHEFTKHNFPQHYQKYFSKGGDRNQPGGTHRVKREVLDLHKGNSFVKKHDVDNWNARHGNHWTHHHNHWNNNANWYWHKHNHWNNHWGYNHFVWSPWIGWGGWGFGYGYTWPSWSVGYYTTPYYGYNYYYTGNNPAPVYASYQAAAPAAPAVPPDPAQAHLPPDPALANPTVATGQTQDERDEEVTEADAASAAAFTEQGEIDFKAGNYRAAAKDWQHALVDDPRNGAVMMLLAQALFAQGKYEEAAGATQAAMQMLPEDRWGVVIANYKELYGDAQDYTDQLRALEAARKAKPDSPALRFLLGFQFGYLNYPKQAVGELDKALALAPRDVGSRKVREIFAEKWPEAPPLPAAVLEASQEGAESPRAADRGAEAPAPADAKPGDKLESP